MDVKREIKWCTQVLKWQQDAVRSGNVREANSCGQLVGQSLDNIGRWADMAEAALAYVEWQIDNNINMPMDGATYIREREKLWDQYKMARAKAREVGDDQEQ